MRNSFLVFIFFCFIFSTSKAQKSDWDQVILYEIQGKVKQADSLVEVIFNKAEAKKNHNIQIKCFVHKSRYLLALDELAQDKIILQLQTFTNNTPSPHCSFYHLIFANILNDYNKYNSRKINSREKLDKPSTDWNLWTKEDFETQILFHHKKSFEDKKRLQDYFVDDFLEIIQKEVNDHVARDLYEFMVINYIDYRISNLKESITFFKETRNAKDFYALPQDFIKQKFDITSDIEDVLFHFQVLEKHYLALKNYEVLYSINKRRIAFVHKIFNDDLLNIAYFKRLSQEALTSGAANIAIYEYAKLKLANANHSNLWVYEVQSYLDSVIKIQADKNVLKGLMYLKESIESPVFSANIESDIYPNENILLKVGYKNLSKINLKLYKVPTKWYHLMDDKSSNQVFENELEDLKKLHFLSEMTFMLPNPNSLLETSTEFALPGLDTGHYFLLFESQSNDLSKIMGYQLFRVNPLKIYEFHQNNKHYFEIVDKISGLPLKNIEVKNNIEKVFTDDFGRVVFTKFIENRYVDFNFIHQNDTLQRKLNHYINKEVKNKKKKKSEKNVDEIEVKSYVFLDRAIYRPGQAVNFKAIIVQNTNETNFKTVSNLYVNAIIYDANYNEVYNQRLKTNAFGSINGSFVLPSNIPTGTFEISIEEDESLELDSKYNKKTDTHPFWDNVWFEEVTQSFEVEEYKRPTFNIIIDPIKENVALGDTIHIQGKILSFSGANMNEADASAHIKIMNNRTSHFDKHIPLSINNEGVFEFSFFTEADEKKGYQSYEITIKATAVDGETQTVSEVLRLSNRGLNLSLYTNDIWNIHEKQSIKVVTSNFNYQPIDNVLTTLNIYKIQDNKVILRNRPWNSPEVQTISKKDFDSLFPFYAYETNKEKIKPEQKDLVYHNTFLNNSEKLIFFDSISSWNSGAYMIETFVIDRDDTLKFSKKIILKDLETYTNQTLDLKIINPETYQKDGYIDLEIASVWDNLHVFVSISDENNMIYDQHIFIKNKRWSKRIPISKNKSAFNVTVQTTFHKSVYKKNKRLFPEFFKDDTVITATSIRNFIAPGAKETWTFEIKNESNRTHTFEVLASMYDKSLDEFSKSNWYKFDNFSDISSPIEVYKSTLSFSNSNNFWYKNLYYPSYNINTQNIDRMNMYGLDFNNKIFKPNYYQKFLIHDDSSSSTSPRFYYGRVNDSVGSLPGATIVAVGISSGVTTDFDGNFKILSFPGQIIEVSFVGLLPTTIKLEDQEFLNITLEEDNESLQEVVVRSFAMAESSKVALTVNSLQGQVAGLTITSNSGVSEASSNVRIRGVTGINEAETPLYIVDGMVVTTLDISELDIDDIVVLKSEDALGIYGIKAINGAVVISTKTGAIKSFEDIELRKNFNETAFFYPNLYTDKKGNLKLEFTSPDAVSQWHFRMFAHNKQAASSIFSSTITTQKKLMIKPNLPRFVRAGDTITIAATVTNLSLENINGKAKMELRNALDEQVVTLLSSDTQNFEISENTSKALQWTFVVPDHINVLRFKTMASSALFSDGEEHFLPVLSNKVLLTDAQPIWVSSNDTMTYHIDALKPQNLSVTATPLSWDLELISNPLWTSLHNLIYLSNFNHECTEQLFSKYFAYKIFKNILSQHPSFDTILETKLAIEANDLLSANETINNIFNTESPWVISQQKKNETVENLRDLKVKAFDDVVVNQLLTMIKSRLIYDGGFSWFQSNTTDFFITNHILAGFSKLHDITGTYSNEEVEIIKSVLNTMDAKYTGIIKNVLKDENKALKNHIFNSKHYKRLFVNYMFVRNSFQFIAEIPEELQALAQDLVNAYKNNWFDLNLYEKAQFAIYLQKSGQSTFAKLVLENLKQTVSNDVNKGIYWIENKQGRSWYNTPIETQIMLMEAFKEISPADKDFIDGMMIWLIQAQQTSSFVSTKSNLLSVHALLTNKLVFLDDKTNISIQASKQNLIDQQLASCQTTSLGLTKITFKEKTIDTSLDQITLSNSGNVPAYGSLKYTYLESLDQVKPKVQDLINIERKYYLVSKKDQSLQLIDENTNITLGDYIKTVITIHTKEDLEYVHINDQRPAGLEPVDVLTQIKYSSGLYYNQSIRDASANFYFDTVKAGTYQIVYEQKANNSGVFSSGITTINCMYAAGINAYALPEIIRIGL